MRTAHKIGGCIALACAFIAPWEGLWTTAKVDTIGTGRPVTYCYGETEGPVRVGEKFTPKECSDRLAEKLPRYNAEISKCIHVTISDKTRASLISFAYNVGSGSLCKAIAPKLNAGNPIAACNALMGFNHAQGRVVRGLTNRRAAEREMCLEGLKPEPEPAKPTRFQTVLNYFKGN